MHDAQKRTAREIKLLTTGPTFYECPVRISEVCSLSATQSRSWPDSAVCVKATRADVSTSVGTECDEVKLCYEVG